LLIAGHGPLFSVGEGEMEVGLGVHGEAGVGRVPLASAHAAVARLLDHMTNPGILSVYNRTNPSRYTFYS
jgi:dihydroxyacetone kinase